MNTEAHLPSQASGDISCDLHSGHCITCSDEAIQVRVLSVDQPQGLAQVLVQEVTEEVDITLLDKIAPDDLLLVHGGVAIARLEVNNA